MMGSASVTSAPGLLRLLFAIILLAGVCSAFDKSMFRTYFGCPKCDSEACDNPTGCELVKEPGICGCCMQCAREQGQTCGVYTEKCGTGLVCRPSDNSATPFEELVLGRGTCLPAVVELEDMEDFRKRSGNILKRISQGSSRSRRFRW